MRKLGYYVHVITLYITFLWTPGIIRVVGLTCYSCTTGWEFDVCVTNVTIVNATKQCRAYQKFCMVVRVETFGKFTSQSRDCVDTCSNHCGIWGDESDIEKCYTCCSTDLCNKSSSADRFCPDALLLIGLILIVCEFVHSSSSGSI